jgi:hypothetical protein
MCTVENGNITRDTNVSSKKPTTTTTNFDLTYNAMIRQLLLTSIQMIPELRETHTRLEVEIMFSRHICSVQQLPDHRDGCNSWNIFYNINYSAEGIKGGEVRIVKKTEQNGVKVLERQLPSSFLDGYIINDRYLFHGAVGLQIDEKKNAQRLVLIFRFFALDVSVGKAKAEILTLNI